MEGEENGLYNFIAICLPSHLFVHLVSIGKQLHHPKQNLEPQWARTAIALRLRMVLSVQGVCANKT
jgi:hypothetical protein